MATVQVKRDPVRGEAGRTVLLLGNEAIARGALESGVQMVTTYPGTPAAEIGDTLARLAEEEGFAFEYSVNEKVALEVAGAAAVSGLRALVAMKHVGVNVAADALMSLAYTGVRGALVLVTADDPGCHSSQNEQDNRAYARMAGLPLLEPATPQEALLMTREAFRLSALLGSPVLLRTTTRVSHARGPVVLGPHAPPPEGRGFVRDPGRFLLLPATARRDHERLLERLEAARHQAEASPFNGVEELGGSPTTGVIASGVAVNYVREALRGGPHALLRLGFTHPLPRERILSFLEAFDRVVVVEELEPLLEEAIRALAQEAGLLVDLLGKADGLFPRTGELTPDLIQAGFAMVGWVPGPREPLDFPSSVPAGPGRPPVLCPGCGHRGVGYALRKATRRHDVVFATDIGCYTLTAMPPLAVGDLLLCMGASISTASGIARATGERTVALIGDSTFYHAGIPALVNAVHHGHDIVLVILDNRTTAMTGHQPDPGVADGAQTVPLEDVVRGCGVTSLRVLEAYDVKALEVAVQEALEEEGVSVLIARHPCRLLENRALRAEGEPLPLFAVDPDLCTACRWCIDALGCPALAAAEDGRVVIDPSLCVGCGVCATVCPPQAIVEVERT